MTTTDRPSPSGGSRDESTVVPRLSGDELFVPASHVLVIDRRVSHPAFRLWCVLHRLWFLREPPTMELLQELMGTASHTAAASSNNGTSAVVWQPATRRSIERWLKELEAAGWLIWSRREEASRRYHLRTSARSAGDSAVLHELRSLLNSGKASLADVQALLGAIPGTTITLPRSDDATLPSHDPIPRSHQDAEATPAPVADATVESHDATAGSHDATPESHHATIGSHHTTPESHHAILPSHTELTQGIRTPSSEPPYKEIFQKEISEDSTPPPAPPEPQAGGGGGHTDTQCFLIQQGFSTRAAQEFRALNLASVQADLERRVGLGQGIGAVVSAWRVAPPREAAQPPDHGALTAAQAARAKAEALVIAPPDATPLEIQYLALDLEDGHTTVQALSHLHHRRSASRSGGEA